MSCVVTLLAVVGVCLSTSVSATAATLIDQAEKAGLLDKLTATIYRVNALRNPHLLPEQYRQEPTTAVCGTSTVSSAAQMLNQLGDSEREPLAKALARPARDFEHVSPSGRFKVHFSVAGRGAVDTTDEDTNGIPDFVDTAAAILDSVWMVEVDEMGYPHPMVDLGFGGGNEIDVYIVELGNNGVYGFTYPEDGSGFTTYSYIELDNNYTDPVYGQTQGLEALRVSAAHEFFHTIHFTYYQGNDTGWWREASATWMEDVIYPEVDDYLQYVPSFLGMPHRALDERQRYGDFRVYGISLFPHFLDQRYDRDVVREIWGEIGRRRSGLMEHYDRALRNSAEAGLNEVVSEFAVWNYFTGDRQHQSNYYAEGDKYVEVRPRTLETVPELVVRDSGRVEHLGAAYIRIPPRLRSGGLILETELPRGSWTRQLILVNQDSVTIRSALRPTEKVAAWDSYDEVVLILVSTELAGFGFDYVVKAEYDPGLTDAVTPTAFQLLQNHPNPFLPDVHQQTQFVFDLSVPSLMTRLSLYTMNGNLVWRRGPESLSARTHNWAWDGRNGKGELVASGTYYYLLQTEDRDAVKTLAVIR